MRIDFLAELPDELCLEILQHVSEVELCRACTVSRTWSRIAADSVLWKRLALSTFGTHSVVRVVSGRQHLVCFKSAFRQLRNELTPLLRQSRGMSLMECLVVSRDRSLVYFLHSMAEPKHPTYWDLSGEWSTGRWVRKKDPVVASCGCQCDNYFVLTTDGDLYLTGSNFEGELGLRELAIKREECLKFVVPPSLRGVRVVAVELANRFTVCLDSVGCLWTSGWGANGRLGMGDTDTRRGFESVPLSRSTSFVSISALGNYALAISASGLVHSWGDDRVLYPCLYSRTTLVPTPVAAFFAEPVVQVAAGAEHGLLLDCEGVVWAFGSGAEGRLGIENSVPTGRELGAKPQPVTVLAPGSAACRTCGRVRIVSAGRCGSAAIMENGALYVWGFLSQRRGVPVVVPERVRAFEGVHIASVSISGTFLAIDVCGRLYVWPWSTFQPSMRVSPSTYESPVWDAQPARTLGFKGSVWRARDSLRVCSHAR